MAHQRFEVARFAAQHFRIAMVSGQLAGFGWYVAAMVHGQLAGFGWYVASGTIEVVRFL